MRRAIADAAHTRAHVLLDDAGWRMARWGDGMIKGYAAEMALSAFELGDVLLCILLGHAQCCERCIMCGREI